MFKLLGNKRLIILLIGMIAFIALMGFTLGNRWLPTWPEKFVKDVVSSVQTAIYKPVRATQKFFSNVGRISVVYGENEQLRHTLAQYARDSALLNDLEAENERLKEALHFTDRQKQLNNYKYHIASVIAQSPDSYNQMIRINLGELDGIKAGMAVATVDGLIGSVQEVSAFSSSVQLLTSLDGINNIGKAVTSTIRGTDVFGIVESFELVDIGDGKNEGRLVMNKIDPNDFSNMKEGDQIITSGLGPLFPYGVLIGTLESIRVGDFGLNYTAHIVPAASFTHLREVFVIEVPELES